jgi:hypothetical protein
MKKWEYEEDQRLYNISILYSREVTDIEMQIDALKTKLKISKAHFTLAEFEHLEYRKLHPEANLYRD